METVLGVGESAPYPQRVQVRGSERMTTITTRQAEAIWDRMSSLFADFEAVLAEAITTRSWEPLGYQSFVEAWAARMGRHRLASAIVQNEVIYAMLEEGASTEAIADAVKGATDNGVDALRRQKANGIPASKASIRVRPHLRKAAREASTLHITPSTRDYERFCAIAVDLGMSNEQLGLEAVRIVVDRGGID